MFKVKRRFPLLIFLLICAAGICGFAIIQMVDKKATSVAVDKIELKIVAVKEMPLGMMYRIMLINGSDFTIKKNAVYLSYPIIEANKPVNKACKVEAAGNRRNIKPGDSVMLKVLVPKESYRNSPHLDMQHPNLEIRGSLKDLKEINHFQKSFSAELPKPAEAVLCAKPVIYLYPVRQERVSVKLSFDGKLGCTYPEYKDGWHVSAAPDGTLVSLYDGREYSYLFWDGIVTDARWDLSRGFVVAGRDSRAFLQEKLPAMGLLPKEYNEFIVYWLPLLEQNKYNLITFAGKEYSDTACLQITPEPESILRVFMVFKPLDRPIEIPPQQINPFNRRGFTVVEWGGTELK